MRKVRKILFIMCCVSLFTGSVNITYSLLASRMYAKTKGNQIINFVVDSEALQSELSSYSEEEIVDFYYDYNKRNIIKPHVLEEITNYEGIIAVDYTVDIEVDIENADPVVPRNDKIYNFMAKGNKFEKMIEFKTGEFELLEGRMYTQDEIDEHAKVCLVTDELASFNNWEVGDEIGISYLLGTGSDIEHLPKSDRFSKFEIIGIYKNNTKDVPSSISTEPGNLILLPSTSIADICVYEYNTVLVDYYLKTVWNEYQPGIERVPMDFYISGISLLVDGDKGFEIINKLENLDIEYSKVTGNVKDFVNKIEYIDELILVNISMLVMIIYVAYYGLKLNNNNEKFISYMSIILLTSILSNYFLHIFYEIFVDVVWFGKNDMLSVINCYKDFEIINVYEAYDEKLVWVVVNIIFMILYFLKVTIKKLDAHNLLEK